MDEPLKPHLDGAQSVLILLPAKFDLDSVAAGLSLYLSLKANKEVSITSPSPMTVDVNRLVGVNKIGSDTGNKNLTIKFVKYNSEDVERVSYDIENSEFRLTVIPKAGLSSPTKDQISVSYSGISAQLIILIGGDDQSSFPALSEIKGAKVIHLGKRMLNVSEPDKVLSLARIGSSISEIIAKIIESEGLEMDRDIATNLIAGIEAGSANFGSNEVTPDTFEMFAFLLRSGGVRQSQVKLSPTNFPPGAIPRVPFDNPVPLSEVEDEPMPMEEEFPVNPPQDWLQPKVFKGTSVS